MDDPLVLHVEVALWDFRHPFVKLQLFLPLLPLLDICIGSWMLRDWLTVAFPLQCVSPHNSPRTSPCLGHSPLVCFACCWLCSSRFFSSFLPFSTMSAALRAHPRFDVLLAVLVPVLLLYLLFTTGSSALDQSRILTTGFLAVALSLSRDTLR